MRTRIFLLVTIFLIPSLSTAKNLEISANFIYTFCTEYFGMVSVEFYNTTDKWIEISSVHTSLGSHEIDKKVSIVTGEKLVSWNEGISHKIQETAFYSRLLLGTLAVAAATAGHSSDSNLVEAATIGSLSALTIYEFSSYKNKIDLGKVVPRTHLLYGNFSVPPELSARRWILYNTDSNKNIPFINTITISAKLKTGEIVKQEIKLRDRNEYSCVWQSHNYPQNEDWDN